MNTLALKYSKKISKKLASCVNKSEQSIREDEIKHLRTKQILIFEEREEN